MKFKPTKEQEQAIYTKGNVLVSAAAGSGKTAVLVERVINKLTDKLNPVSADRLLIVTFTNAAASEMRTRIEKALDDKCRNNPNDLGLLQQRQLISSEKICTIDSFCIELVRQNFDKVFVNPDFKISDVNALKDINESVISEIISEHIEKDDEIFNSLLEISGSEYDETNLINIILSLYNYSRQLPFPKLWFETLPTFYGNGEFTCNCKWYKEAFSYAYDVIDKMRKSLSEVYDNVPFMDEEKADTVNTLFQETSTLMSQLFDDIQLNDWDKFYNSIFAIQSFGNINLNKFRKIPEMKSVKSAFESFNGNLKDIKKLFFADSVEMTYIFKKLYQPVKLLSKILIDFDEKLFDKYNENNTFTFHNTEHLALKLLCNESGKINENAMEIINQYDEVMVDEYQDTNDLQDMLFYALSDKERKLFVVGDIKQSIYGFRGANPQNFLKKKDKYIPIDKALENDSKKISLGSNFRSRSEICTYVNFFFSNIMHKENGGIEYDKEEFLIPGANFPKIDEPAVQFDIINAKGCQSVQLKLQARHIADYIKQTVNGKECIRKDDNLLRKARYSDFVILLRNTLGKANVIADELRAQGIPVNFTAGDYATSTEIATFLSLLKVIDNQRSDIDLLCVLTSPIFSFSVNEIADIRANSIKGDLFSSILFAAESGNEKCKNALDTLQKYRLYASTLTLPKLITRLLNETGYADIVSALNEGSIRRNNLFMLSDYALTYLNANSGGINGFVKFIIKQSNAGLKSASSNSGGESVKIMSIHMSKGLQFPVCIIANTATDFNDNEAKMNIIYSCDNGIGFRFYDEERKERITSLGREIIANNSRMQRREEELRLLYVAMTRAQDKLLFIGQNSENKIEKFKLMLMREKYQINSSVFDNTKSYFDWLLLTSLIHPDAKALKNEGDSFICPTESHIKVNIINEEDISVTTENTDINDNMADEEQADIIAQNIKYEYPYQALLDIESKTSVSDVANAAESEKYAFTAKPSFMSVGGVTATERGTAIHKVMQFVNFDNGDKIEEEIERLREWKYISDMEADAVKIDLIVKFFNSSIFKRIKNSNNVKRELRFITEVPIKYVNTNIDNKFNNESVIIQGAVDLCFEENGKIIVVDFKTDRVKDGSQLSEAYSKQLEIYALACEKIFKKPVSEKIIYSFSLNKEINI